MAWGNISCQGKIGYSCWTEAAKIIRRQYRKLRGRKLGMGSIYRCEICRKWHVGGGEERD